MKKFVFICLILVIGIIFYMFVGKYYIQKYSILNTLEKRIETSDSNGKDYFNNGAHGDELLYVNTKTGLKLIYEVIKNSYPMDLSINKLSGVYIPPTTIITPEFTIKERNDILYIEKNNITYITFTLTDKSSKSLQELWRVVNQK